MLTPTGVGFYSYMTAMVFGDTSISVDEVTSPRFFIVINSDFGLLTKKNNQPNKEKLMKTLRLLNTLFFIALTVSFVACSNDDEASSEYPPETALKPTKWTFIYGYDYEFYDDKDRLIKIERYNNAHELSSTINIEYSYGYITASERFYDSSNRDLRLWKYTLNSNGVIEKMVLSCRNTENSSYTSSTYLFTYDENNQLTRIAGVDNKNSDCQITWRDGNIVKVEWPEFGTATYEYTSIPSWRGYCAFFDDSVLDIFPDYNLTHTLANHGCFGAVPRYLPSAEIYEDGDVYYMNYTLGENGYVVQFDDSYSDEKVSIDWE